MTARGAPRAATPGAQMTNGDQATSPDRVPDGHVAARYWSRVDRRGDGECWPWLGSSDGRHGNMTVKGRTIGAHRIAWMLANGPIPAGLVVHHVCQNGRCVNPRHLMCTTQRENIMRGNAASAVNARKVQCVHGHPLSGANLKITKRGERQCQVCRRLGKARYRARRTQPRPASLAVPADRRKMLAAQVDRKRKRAKRAAEKAA